MNFFDLDVSYFRSNESFFVGLFHGTLFSLPISLPAILALMTTKSREVVGFGSRTQIFFSQFRSIFSLLLGYVLFFSLICFCSRPLIQFWYTFEPFLSFLGICLFFSLGTKLANDSRPQLNPEDGGLKIFLSNPLFARFDHPILETVFRFLQSIVFWQVFLFFLNPVFPAIPAKILLSQDILEHTGIQYFLGFLCTSTTLFGIYTFIGPKFLQAIFQILHFCARYIQFGIFQIRQKFSDPNLEIPEIMNSVPLFDKQKTKKIFSFCLLGLVIHGSLQYTWRLFTQYPLDFVYGPSAISTPDSGKISSSSLLTRLVQREFPSFDSSIRHREKNLPVERHIPIERMNARRTLSGRPPLNEEQKSDAFVKYNSFFLNKLEQIFEDIKLQAREGKKQEPLHKSFSQEIQGKTEFIKSELQVLNTGKGKPKFSYIRELWGQTPGQANQISGNQISYIHDDLSVYNAIFHFTKTA
jgi:hypothetical protein